MTSAGESLNCTNMPRDYEHVLAHAIEVLTEAARCPNGTGAIAPGACPDHVDFAEFLTLAVAGAAANVGGVEALLAGRPGSWEADQVRSMVHSTVGYDEDHLFQHRTEPLVVSVHVDNLLTDLGYAALFDDADAELARREELVLDAAPDKALTIDQEAEIKSIEDLFASLEDLRRADWTAYAEAFRQEVMGAVAERYPDLRVPTSVVIELDWQDDPEPSEWWTPADEVRSIACERTPMPSSGIPPSGYSNIGAIAATERAAGRDPLARLAQVPTASRVDRLSDPR